MINVNYHGGGENGTHDRCWYEGRDVMTMFMALWRHQGVLLMRTILAEAMILMNDLDSNGGICKPWLRLALPRTSESKVP